MDKRRQEAGIDKIPAFINNTHDVSRHLSTCIFTGDETERKK